MADKNTVYMSEKQKVKEITDKLEAGLKELFESEKYKSYLSTMSKFHNYSFNNTLLIAMQKPEQLHLLLMWYFHIREIPKYMPTRLWFVLWRMAGYNMYPIELYPPRIILRKHGIRHG